MVASATRVPERNRKAQHKAHHRPLGQRFFHPEASEK